MEEWNIGILGFLETNCLSLFHHSVFFSHIIPSFHYSIVPPSLFFFRAPLKYSFYLVSPLDQAGEERDFPLHKEHHARDEVCQEVSASEFIIDQHRCLMHPSASPDALDKGFVEKMDIFLPGRNPFFNGHLSQGIRQDTDIDLIGTSGPAGLTGDTEPDGAASKDLLLHPHLDHPDDIVRPDIHDRGSGTTCRALQTLITEAELFSASLLRLLQET